MTKFEVEIKAQCYDKNSFIEKVTGAGAVHVETREEIDTYFNHSQKNFAETDEALRLRKIGDKTYITYKGPKVSTKSKTRLEEESIVESFDSVKKILLLLGFTEYGEVVKTRMVYNYSGIEICIDTIEKLGDFIELETKSSHPQEAENNLLNIAGSFGITDFTRKSYLEMVLEEKLLDTI